MKVRRRKLVVKVTDNLVSDSVGSLEAFDICFTSVPWKLEKIPCIILLKKKTTNVDSLLYVDIYRDLEYVGDSI